MLKNYCLFIAEKMLHKCWKSINLMLKKYQLSAEKVLFKNWKIATLN